MALGHFLVRLQYPAAQITYASSLENEQQMSKGHHFHRNSQVIVMPLTELEAHTWSEGISGAEEPWLAPCGAKNLWMEYPRKITSIHEENFFSSFYLKS